MSSTMTSNTISETKLESATQYERRWVAVVALGLSLFLSALDATIVALALPPLTVHFHISDSLVASVTLAYAIPLTVLVLPAGSLVNKFRSFPLFLTSVIGFGIGSLICGLAPNLFVLLVGRVVQGSFAAVIATQGFAVAASVVSEKERGKAMGIVGTIAPLGGVVGPGIGGLLLANYGWSAIFFVNIPVIVIASVLGAYSLKGVYLTKHGHGGNIYSQMVSLIRRPKFLFAAISFFFSVATSVALYYLLPFDLSGVQHMPLALSGTIFLTVPLGMMIMGMIGGYLTDRYQAKRLILIGSAMLFAGALFLSLVATSKTSDLIFVGNLLVIGAGLGLFSSPITTVIMSLGGRELMGAASALTNLSARLATVFGPLAMGITWILVASFSSQIAFGMFLVDSLALITVIFACALATKMNDEGSQAKLGADER
jgi:MFS family permease